jgi:hypothetical protein
MRVHVRLPDKTQKIFKILIDTGAEVNLVKQSAIPQHFFKISPKPLRLITASGDEMFGGKREVELLLVFDQFWNGIPMCESFEGRGAFYEAKIDVDAILSYRWLYDNQLGVFPHLHALAKNDKNLTLLRGLNKRKRSLNPPHLALMGEITVGGGCKRISSKGLS